MSTKTIAGATTRTAPELIRDCAALICQHGWCCADDPDTPTMNLVTAAVWAVAGPGHKMRDLTEIQAAHVAELLDHIEDGLEMGTDEYARSRQDIGGFAVALDLEVIALRFQRELRTS